MKGGGSCISLPKSRAKDDKKTGIKANSLDIESNSTLKKREYNSFSDRTVKKYFIYKEANNLFYTGRILNGRKIYFKVKFKEEDNLLKITIPGHIHGSYYGEMLLYYNSNNHSVYLGLLTIIPQQYPENASVHEKKIFKGLGKIMLYFGLEYLLFECLKMNYSQIINMSITLSAQSGTSLKCVNSIYSNLSYKTAFNILLKYQSHIDNFEDLMQPDNLYNMNYLVCLLKNEKKLAKYYATLGFRIPNPENNILLPVTNENIDSYIDIEMNSEYKPNVSLFMKTYVAHLINKTLIK